MAARNGSMLLSLCSWDDNSEISERSISGEENVFHRIHSRSICSEGSTGTSCNNFDLSTPSILPPFPSTAAIELSARTMRLQLDLAKSLGICDASGRDVAEEDAQDIKPEMSLGAKLHSIGQCKPCGWFWKPVGCSNGSDCQHCHLCEKGEIRSRRKRNRHGSSKAQKDSLSSPFIGIGAETLSQLSSSYSNIPPPPPPFTKAESTDSLAETQIAKKTSFLEKEETEPGGLSVGSADHKIGKCKPCSWYHSPKGCQHGPLCQHCHLCPKGEITRRRRMKNQERVIKSNNDSQPVGAPKTISSNERISAMPESREPAWIKLGTPVVISLSDLQSSYPNFNNEGVRYVRIQEGFTRTLKIES